MAKDKYFIMKHTSEKLWSEYLNMAESDIDKLDDEIMRASKILDYLGLKRASAALTVCMTKTFLDINEKYRGL
jgi:hypothetical protein